MANIRVILRTISVVRIVDIVSAVRIVKTRVRPHSSGRNSSRLQFYLLNNTTPQFQSYSLSNVHFKNLIIVEIVNKRTFYSGFS